MTDSDFTSESPTFYSYHFISEDIMVEERIDDQTSLTRIYTASMLSIILEIIILYYVPSYRE